MHRMLPMIAVPGNVETIGMLDQLNANSTHNLHESGSRTPETPREIYAGDITRANWLAACAYKCTINSDQKQRTESSGCYRRNLPTLSTYSKSNRHLSRQHSPCCKMLGRNSCTPIPAQGSGSATGGCKAPATTVTPNAPGRLTAADRQLLAASGWVTRAATPFTVGF